MKQGCGTSGLGSQLLAVLYSAAVLASCRCHAGGVTIITHGFNGNVTDWIIPMAEQIPRYDQFPGGDFSCYVISVASDYSVSQSSIGGVSPTESDSGEIIIKLDWSELSIALDVSTTDIARAVVPMLLATNFIPELGGRSLVELPIHLIGHSRGGSVITELARLLGRQGAWVDHITTLDPHPVAFPYGDAEVVLYQNVLFADNYWQTNPDGACPNGESVVGAYNRYSSNLPNGYSCNHSDVHLWYHGTIDWFDTPATDTQATITGSERTNWWTTFEAGGALAGFKYSLIGGGNRQSTNEPAGPGNGRIRDGFNQFWDFGAGVSNNRFVLSTNSGTWPNIIKLNLAGTNVVTMGSPVAAKFYYQCGDSSSNVLFQVYFDQDSNPYTPNSTLITQGPLTNTGVGTVSSVTVGLNTTNVLPGTYAIYAKIQDGAQARYLYAPESVQVMSSKQPPSLAIAQTGPAQFGIGVNGMPGQTIVLQTSTNLQHWLPLVTNTMATSHWTHTNTPPTGVTRQYYRAVLSP